jgi:hypothetical protein
LDCHLGFCRGYCELIAGPYAFDLEHMHVPHMAR